MSSSGDAHVSDLRKHEICGGLVEEFIAALEANPDFGGRVVQVLLTDYFPPSLHKDILEDVGLLGKLGPIWMSVTRTGQEVRDPHFRPIVLEAYKCLCALCELDVQVDGQPVGIEAAHNQVALR